MKLSLDLCFKDIAHQRRDSLLYLWDGFLWDCLVIDSVRNFVWGLCLYMNLGAAVKMKWWCSQILEDCFSGSVLLVWDLILEKKNLYLRRCKFFLGLWMMNFFGPCASNDWVLYTVFLGFPFAGAPVLEEWCVYLANGSWRCKKGQRLPCLGWTAEDLTKLDQLWTI